MNAAAQVHPGPRSLDRMPLRAFVRGGRALASRGSRDVFGLTLGLAAAAAFIWIALIETFDLANGPYFHSFGVDLVLAWAVVFATPIAAEVFAADVRSGWRSAGRALPVAHGAELASRLASIAWAVLIVFAATLAADAVRSVLAGVAVPRFEKTSLRVAAEPLLPFVTVGLVATCATAAATSSSLVATLVGLMALGLAGAGSYLNMQRELDGVGLALYADLSSSWMRAMLTVPGACAGLVLVAAAHVVRGLAGRSALLRLLRMGVVGGVASLGAWSYEVPGCIAALTAEFDDSRGAFYHPSPSPDGRQVLVPLQHEALIPWIVDVETGEARRVFGLDAVLTLGAGTRWGPKSIGWSVSGRELLTGAHRAGVDSIAIDVETGELRRVLPNESTDLIGHMVHREKVEDRGDGVTVELWSHRSDPEKSLEIVRRRFLGTATGPAGVGFFEAEDGRLGRVDLSAGTVTTVDITLPDPGKGAHVLGSRWVVVGRWSEDATLVDTLTGERRSLPGEHAAGISGARRERPVVRHVEDTWLLVGMDDEVVLSLPEWVWSIVDLDGEHWIATSKQNKGALALLAADGSFLRWLRKGSDR